MAKPKVKIDVVSDTVCPWCYIGKARLEKAMSKYQDKLDFEVQWRPFMLNPAASKEGVDKMEMYLQKFGPEFVKTRMPMVVDTFRQEGLPEMKMGGKTGNTLNSHRLLTWAAREFGTREQNALAEKLFQAYFCQEKFLNDRQVLLEAVDAAGLPVQQAEKVLDDESAYLDEVEKDMREYTADVRGVPNFKVAGQYQLSGAQDPAAFEQVFDRLSHQ